MCRKTLERSLEMAGSRSVGSEGYDVIGDVHGYVDKLVGLLESMGYRQFGGSYRHETRTAVFIGDLIDRKLKIGDRDQCQVVEIVRSMVESGAARIVMGNHEFNAISWATPERENPDEFLRTHDGEKGAGHRRQHEQFLLEVGEGSEKHGEIISWFRTIPLWIDLGHARFVHACWFPESMNLLRDRLNTDLTLTDEVLIGGNRKGHVIYDAIENVLKGPEASLDPEHHYLDKNGILRKKGRIRWWDDESTTWARAIDMQSDAKSLNGDVHPGLPDTPTDVADRFRYLDDVPVFFGHYWETGTPRVAGRSTVCVDYSAGRGGPLVAYRWSGGALADGDFVSFGK